MAAHLPAVAVLREWLVQTLPYVIPESLPGILKRIADEGLPEDGGDLNAVVAIGQPEFKVDGTKLMLRIPYVTRGGAVAYSEYGEVEGVECGSPAEESEAEEPEA